MKKHLWSTMTADANPHRKFAYFAAPVVMVLLGLGSRDTDFPLPEFVATHAGVVCWAALVFETGMIFWVKKTHSINVFARITSSESECAYPVTNRNNRTVSFATICGDSAVDAIPETTLVML